VVKKREAYSTLAIIPLKQKVGTNILQLSKALICGIYFLRFGTHTRT